MTSGNTKSMLRWTDEEHKILVQLTNDQIHLEHEDKSQEISWAAHWRKVSAFLQEHGYNRTNTACQGYWKRVVESQKASDAAAGPRWDDTEHQTLLGMTEDQLALEKIDSSAVIPWPKHWKKVSLRLQDLGYERSANACAAYWLKKGYDFSVDIENGAEANDSQDDEDQDEDDQIEDDQLEDDLPEEDQAEDDRAQEDEAEEEGPDVDEEALKELASKAFQTNAQSRRANPLQSNNTSVFTPSVTPVPSEHEASEDEYRPLHRQPSKSKMSQTPIKSTPIKSETTPPKKSSARGFRFTPEQRSMLEADVVQNGLYPDSQRRAELAQRLGVEEKTIRNWFVNNRNKPSLYNSPHPNASNNAPRDVQPKQETSQGPLPGDKRPLERPEEGVHKVDEAKEQPSKRARVEEEHRETRFTLPNMPQSTTSGPASDAAPIGKTSPESVPQSGQTPDSGHDSNKSSRNVLSNTQASAATPNTVHSHVASPRTNYDAFFGRSSTAAPVSAPTRDDKADQPASTRQHPHHPTIPQSHQPSQIPHPSQPPRPQRSSSGSAWHAVNTTLDREIRPSEVLRSNTNAAEQPQPSPIGTPHPGAHIQPRPASIAPQEQPSFRPIRNEPIDDNSEKAWMSRKVSSFQHELEDLNREKHARLHRLGMMDGDLHHIHHERTTLLQLKDAEIVKAMREIEERFKARQESIQGQHHTMTMSKDTELEGLRRNGLEIVKKQTAMEHWKALLGLADEEES